MTWEAEGGGRQRDYWEQHSGGLGFWRRSEESFLKETCSRLIAVKILNSVYHSFIPENLCAAPLPCSCLFSMLESESLASARMRDETTGKATDSSKGMVVIIITGCVCGRRGPCVLIRFVEEVDRQRRHLRALAANAAGELNVLGHDGNTLVGFGVWCVWFRVPDSVQGLELGSAVAIKGLDAVVG